MRKYVRRGLTAAFISGGFVLLGTAVASADTNPLGGLGDGLHSVVAGVTSVGSHGGTGGNSGDAGNASSGNTAVSGNSGDSGSSGATGGNHAASLCVLASCTTSVSSGNSGDTGIDRQHRDRDEHQHHHRRRLRYGGQWRHRNSGGHAHRLVTRWPRRHPRIRLRHRFRRQQWQFR
ncbi:hypothetical protein QRX50_19420 [Amycolatopsis carbonis]|uniref:Secreted protein n=1 Tax=Amycolatopsis carbonis TaxID=715471 RepID=A0A9Y2IQA4_9PSEU|nr:hypothetical protein [Amycolatopsis sp. 2-15]WIX82788.1 hypothetical protein QRX50_19420 [Amycolatopsis sp. 2-15]